MITEDVLSRNANDFDYGNSLGMASNGNENMPKADNRVVVPDTGDIQTKIPTTCCKAPTLKDNPGYQMNIYLSTVF